MGNRGLGVTSQSGKVLLLPILAWALLFSCGDSTVTQAVYIPPDFSPEPENIILFIGDGMGRAQREVASYSAHGDIHSLRMDQLPNNALINTDSLDGVTDSAAAATAMACGVRTNNGKVGISSLGWYLQNVFEYAKSRGLALGVITTVQLSHATPAGFLAHAEHRSMMTDIALQIANSGAEVLIGGGESYFLPTGTAGLYPEMGKRTDNRDLIGEMTAKGYTRITTLSELQAASLGSSKVLGLLGDEEMIAPYPISLEDLVLETVRILSADPDGFVLMVEEGLIDWGGHLNNLAIVTARVLDLDQAVSGLLDSLDSGSLTALADSTLVLVTGDHETGGLSYGIDADTGDLTPYWTTTGHTGAEVPLGAIGSGSSLIVGNLRNTDIYRIFFDALSP